MVEIWYAFLYVFLGYPGGDSSNAYLSILPFNSRVTDEEP